MMKKFKDLITANGVFSDGNWVESKDQDPNGDVRLIQLADIGVGTFINKSNRFMTSEKAEELKCTYLEKGDILIARMPEPIGRACIFPELKNKCVTVVDICIVRPASDEIDSRWLMHLINSERFNNQILKFVTGTTRQRISRGNLAKLDVEVPPLDEQKRIAAILDKADSVRRKRQQAIDLADDFLRSVFLDMFGDPVTNPKGWDVKNIVELASSEKYSIKRGPFGGALKKEIFVDSGYLVYEQYHALNNDFTFARYFIDDEKYQELKAFDVGEGDIIISCSGVNLGRLAIVPKGSPKGIINQALLKVKLDESKMLNEMFVSIFTHPNFKREFFGDNRGSGVPNFPPMSTFKEFGFIVPPLEKQQKYISLVHKVEQLKMKIKSSYELSLAEFNSLSQKAFAGEL
ncbi:MAG: restriction endonuclease subunit S [Pseudoalteromonas sp.]|jgi:type I restriction enzyme S subunit|uniref:restriction endonuclease subunit S n=1 Tax=Pseudoalteromonas sp. TaxID=53249 RepID=UPI0007B79AE7|nr:hypothetical protein A3733_16225 [Pseudoalteromonas shioyasakiensis]MAB61721.1 restriction endonuclease subunit S [Pseudoalteromonas sp.]